MVNQLRMHWDVYKICQLLDDNGKRQKGISLNDNDHHKYNKNFSNNNNYTETNYKYLKKYIFRQDLCLARLKQVKYYHLPNKPDQTKISAASL